MHIGDVDNIEDASLMNAVKQWVFSNSFGLGLRLGLFNEEEY